MNAIPAAMLSVVVQARGIKQTNAELTGTHGVLNAVHGAAGRVVSQLMRLAKYGALAAAAGIGVAVKKAIDFDKELRNVNSIAQLTEKRLGRVREKVLELAGETAQAPVTLAAGLYDLVSSGFDADESLGILAKSAKAATAGLTSAEVATAAVAAVLNAYQLKAGMAGDVSDVLFRIVDRGVISFESLASNVGDVLPFAASLGIDLREVGASIATMTKAGISAPETMTRIKAVMVTMLKPGKALNETIRELGYESGEAMINTLGFQGTLDALAGAADGSKEVMGAMFPNIRALGGALALTGKNSKVAGEDLKGMQEAAGATDRALSQQSKSISYQWNQLKATAEALGIQFGSKLLPELSRVMKVITNPNLTTDEKVTAVFDQIVTRGTEGLKALVSAAEDYGPEVVGALASGMLDAWVDMNPLGKLLTAAAIVRVVGGKGAITAAGATIGRWLGIGVSTAVAAEIASSGTIAAAATRATATASALSAAPIAAASLPPAALSGLGGFSLASVGNRIGREAPWSYTRPSGDMSAASRKTMEAYFGGFTLAAAAGGPIDKAGPSFVRRLTSSMSRAANPGALRGLATRLGSVGSTAGRQAASGIAAAIPQTLKNVRWARVGGIGLGLALADTAISEFSRRSAERSDDLGEALNAMRGPMPLGLDLFGDAANLPVVGGLFDLKDSEKAARNLSAQYDEMVEKRVRISAATEEGLRSQVAELDLTKEQHQQIESMLNLMQAGRGLDLKVGIGMDPAQLRQLSAGFYTLRSGVLTSMGDINKVVRDNAQVIATQLPKGSQDARQKTAENFRAAVIAIGKGMAAGDIEVKQGLRRQKELFRNAKLITGSDPLGIAKGFADSWKKAGGINAERRRDMIADLAKMPPAARRKAYDTMVEYGQGLVHGGKIPKQDLRDFKSAAVTQFEDLRGRATQSSLDLAIGIAGNFGSMGSAVANVLQVINANTNNSLEAFGAKPVKFTVQAVDDVMGFAKSNFGTGQAKQSGGFIVPGNWTGDRPGFWGEAGGYVLNREATGAFGFRGGGAVPLALESGERYFSPPEVKAYGAGSLEAMNRAVPRQKGGPVGKPEIAGPAGPLLDIAQGARDKAWAASRDYVQKHRPKPTGGPAGDAFVGPPPGMKQLGDNAWVDSHTRTVASYLASKFGSTISSDYRDPAHNAAVGGVPNSSHTRGSAANPGAFDFVPPSTAMQQWAGQHIAGLTENMIHDVGSGLHNHIAFFKLGGLVQALAGGGFVAADESQKKVALTIAEDLLGYGLNYKGAAGIIGNAWRESLWDPASIGTGGRGLYGFDWYEQQLLEAADKKGVSWSNIAFQNEFMWEGPEPASKLKGSLNGQASAASAAEYFDTVWERSGVKAMSDRKNGAREAMALMLGAKLRPGDEDAHSYQEDVPAVFRGLRTKDLSFPSMPKTLQGVNREIHRWQDQVGDYRHAVKAAKKGNHPAIVQALEENVREIENQLRKLRHERKKLKVGVARKAFTRKLGRQLSKITGYEDAIEQARGAYDKRTEYAEEVVDLEPLQGQISNSATEQQRQAAEEAYVQQITGYVEGQERPAFQAVLGAAGTWRNTILGAERGATRIEEGWEGELRTKRLEVASIDHFSDQVAERVRKWNKEKKKGEEMPDWLVAQVEARKTLVERLPTLRFQDGELSKVLIEGRGAFFPGSQWIEAGKLIHLPGVGAVKGTGSPIDPPDRPTPGTGTFEDAMREVQGSHWPGSHELLAALPAERVPGRFGGAIWQAQSAIADLGLKVSEAAASIQPAGPSGADSEHLALVEELLRQANQRNAVAEAQGAVMADWDYTRRGYGGNFAGLFASGGVIPPGMWGIAGETGRPEIVHGGTSGARVFSPAETEARLGQGPAESGGGGRGASLEVNVRGGIVPAPGVSADEVIEILEKDRRSGEVITRKVFGAQGVGVNVPGNRV